MGLEKNGKILKSTKDLRSNNHFMRFDDLALAEPILRAVAEEGYTEPTPIQQQAIPHLLAGDDILGCAQTGTGKTAAFALPILQMLAAEGQPPKQRPLRALVLTPTRELAQQIYESFRAYGRHVPLRYAVVLGGVSQKPQEEALKKGIDVLIATPGRLLDLMRQRIVHLDKVGLFVLDEADRMLDMGFIDDVKTIIDHLPSKRQNLLFSATLPPAVLYLAGSSLHNPVQIHVTPECAAAETVAHHLYLVEKGDKQALIEYLLKHEPVTRALVFTSTKRKADHVVADLKASGVRAEVIHADRSQRSREEALEHFKSGKARVLVASDILSRGIDVEDISHVINYDMPRTPETYVHRIGRTGRAGAAGTAMSLCTIDDRFVLAEIEKLIRQPLKIISDHPFPSPLGHTSRCSDDDDTLTVAEALAAGAAPAAAACPPPAATGMWNTRKKVDRRRRR